MSFVGKISPARFWRAFFVFCATAALAGAAVVPAKPPELAQVGLPDAAEAKQILAQFRQAGIPGHYFLEFQLHGLPRRGDEVIYRGRLWGGRNDQGAVTRVELTDGAGKVSRLLIQDGEQAAVSRFADGKMQPLDVAATFAPVIPGLEITAFDLQRPFVYWPAAKLERLERVRGRPAYAFVFPAPAAVTAQKADLTAVRAFLDTQYNALMQIEYLGTRGVVKTISLVDLKKIGDQWIPKSFDVRNDVSRDKTRFLVTAAALNLQLPPAVFAPASLAETVPSPTDKLVRLD
jgi:hypothetical protein